MKTIMKATLPLLILLAGGALGYLLFPPLVDAMSSLFGGGSSPASPMVLPLIQIMGLFVGFLIAFAVAIPVERRFRTVALADIPVEAIEMRLTGRGTDDKGTEMPVDYFVRNVPSDKLSAFWSQPSPSLVLRVFSKDGVCLGLGHSPDNLYQESEPDPRAVVVRLIRGRRVLHALETSGNGHFSAPEGSTQAYCWFYLRYLGCEEVDDFATLRFKGPVKVMKAIFLS